MIYRGGLPLHVPAPVSSDSEEEDRLDQHCVSSLLAGDQHRSLFSQPLATAGGLPLLVPTATMMDSEDDEGESTRD